jgi:hypothetical protein
MARGRFNTWAIALALSIAACSGSEAEPSDTSPTGAPPDDANDAGDDLQADAAPNEMLDATLEPADAGNASAPLDERCEVELSPMPQPGDPAPTCILSTIDTDEVPAFMLYVVTQGDRMMTIDWAYGDLTVGTTVELPHYDPGSTVRIDYFTPDGARRQAVSGTVRISAARDDHYEIELTGVRIDQVADLEISGTIGAELVRSPCLICQ